VGLFVYVIMQYLSLLLLVGIEDEELDAFDLSKEESMFEQGDTMQKCCRLSST
jgi:hypothetical protein